MKSEAKISSCSMSFGATVNAEKLRHALSVVLLPDRSLTVAVTAVNHDITLPFYIGRELIFQTNEQMDKYELPVKFFFPKDMDIMFGKKIDIHFFFF